MCFDYCHQLDVLVTGSLDHVVRVWNPHVPSRPMARLTAHAAVVLDVLVDRHRPGLLFSFSQDSVRPIACNIIIAPRIINYSDTMSRVITHMFRAVTYCALQ